LEHFSLSSLARQDFLRNYAELRVLRQMAVEYNMSAKSGFFFPEPINQ
jgi:hypothetical protein